ncbi:MAG: hypothetical protein L6Q37_02380 [Bdellovibrionaceae bacterium]|nr:hypothetical protein [Pseudobdellovibrionaceae bacterium]NUM58541.1 hypothetical protein [Pseudobdellovibrionaceae bacterium]
MKFLMYLVFFCNLGKATPTMELEHNFVDFEGGSWGIEGVLKKKLDISEQKLPEIFKTPLQTKNLKIVKLKEIAPSNKYFIDSKIFLYQELQICIDKKIDFRSSGFNQSAEQFLDKISRISSNEKALKVHLVSVDFTSELYKKSNTCDVFVLIGKTNEFPFSEVPTVKLSSSEGASNKTQMLLGLYYRHSEQSTPVIVFNPELQLDFSSSSTNYLYNSKDGQLVVDGRVLFFHELGHLLGFSHLPKSFSWNPVGELNIMGGSLSIADRFYSNLRFYSKFEIWKNWDLRQTNIYRSLLARWSKMLPVELDIQETFSGSNFRYCFLPEENFHIYFPIMDVKNLSGIENFDNPSGANIINFSKVEDIFKSSLKQLKIDYKVNEREQIETFETAEENMSSLIQLKYLERTKYSIVSQNSTKEDLNEEESVVWLLSAVNGDVKAKSSVRSSVSIRYVFKNKFALPLPLFRFEVQEDQSQCFKKL